MLTGISGHHMDRLQFILNAAAQLVFFVRRSNHITPLLYELHWLRVSWLIQFRLCVLAYCCFHDTVPAYLAERLHLTTDVLARCRLRFADSRTLLVPPIRRSSPGDRAFPVAVPSAWNKLPSSVRTAASLPVFLHDLKTLLFQLPFD